MPKPLGRSMIAVRSFFLIGLVLVAQTTSEMVIYMCHQLIISQQWLGNNINAIEWGWPLIDDVMLAKLHLFEWISHYNNIKMVLCACKA